jgi:hypothetical protein
MRRQWIRVVLAVTLGTAGCGKGKPEAQAGGAKADAEVPRAAPARVVVGECGPATALFDSGPRPPPADGAVQGGVLGVLRSEPGSVFGSITGTGDIGTGGIGAIGHGVGTSSGYGIGAGRGGLGGSGRTTPRALAGVPTVTGALDKNVVRRYVRQKLPMIEYCYAKRLVVEPELEGTMVATFTIGGDGAVTQAKTSGLGSAEVERCVAEVLEIVQFPKPQDGKPVQVQYPFTFRAAQPLSPVAPAPRVAAAPDAAPPPPPGGPLVGHEAAIGACLARQSRAWGVALLELTADDAGKVTGAKALGLNDGPAATCLAELGEKLTVADPADRGQTLRCPMAWGAAPLEALPHIDVDATSITWGGTAVAEVAPIAADETPTFRIAPLYDALRADATAREQAATPVALVGPVLVRAADSTTGRVLNRVLSTALVAETYVVLAANGPGGWRILLPIEVPVVPVERGRGGPWGGKGPGLATDVVPDEVPMVLSVLVVPDGVWVGVTTGERMLVKDVNGAIDLPAVEAALRELKGKGPLAARADAEIGLDDPATYGRLVRVFDLMVEVGFRDTGVVAPQALSVKFTM